MLRLVLLVMFAAASFAQTPKDAPGSKPPADVDQALRARVADFYNLLVKEEFRKAEAFVAEDTKDYYYNLNKPKFESLQLVRIDYSDGFTRATAIIATERYLRAPNFPPDFKIKGQMKSTWKLENGKWCWYVDQSAPLQTPYGLMNLAQGAAAGGQAIPAPSIPALPATSDFVFNQVKPDKDSLSLNAGGSGQVTFTNKAPGAMKLVVESKPDGLKAALDSAEIPAGGKAVLTVEAGAGARSGEVHVRVQQTTELFAIRVTVK